MTPYWKKWGINALIIWDSGSFSLFTWTIWGPAGDAKFYDEMKKICMYSRNASIRYGKCIITACSLWQHSTWKLSLRITYKSHESICIRVSFPNLTWLLCSTTTSLYITAMIFSAATLLASLFLGSTLSAILPTTHTLSESSAKLTSIPSCKPVSDLLTSDQARSLVTLICSDMPRMKTCRSCPVDDKGVRTCDPFPAYNSLCDDMPEMSQCEVWTQSCEGQAASQ